MGVTEIIVFSVIIVVIVWIASIFAKPSKANEEGEEDNASAPLYRETETPSTPLNIEGVPYVVVDVETTGLSPEEDAIVQLSAIRYVGKNPVDQISTYINPGRHIPASSTKIHGISDVTVINAPDISSLKKSFMDLIDGAVLMGYNAKFDLNFLDYAFDGALDRVTYIDVLYMARKFLSLPNYRLETVARSIGVALSGHFHDAVADCTATAAVFFHLADRCDEGVARTFYSKAIDEVRLRSYNYYSSGDRSRVDGRFEEAFENYQKAQEIGFDMRSIYTSYAMAYRKLKDYDKEIAILEEAIQKFDGEAAAKFQERKSRAEELRASHQRREEEERQRAIRREQRAERHRQEEELAKSKPKKAAGRAVIQCAEDGTEIQQFETVTAAAEAMGIHPKGIRDAAIGKQKRAAGFAWRYAETLEAEE